MASNPFLKKLIQHNNYEQRLRDLKDERDAFVLRIMSSYSREIDHYTRRTAALRKDCTHTDEHGDSAIKPKLPPSRRFHCRFCKKIYMDPEGQHVALSPEVDWINNTIIS